MKNVRNFVFAASFVLAGWLGLTFVSEVPTNRYPSLGKGSVSISKNEVSSVDVSVALESSERQAEDEPVAH